MYTGPTEKIHIQEDGTFIRPLPPTRHPWVESKLQPRLQEIRQALTSITCEATVIAGVNRDGCLVDYCIFSDLHESSTRCDNEAVRQMVRATRPHGVIAAHNHPSGVLRPSVEDLDAYEELDRLLMQEGITFIDELIVGPDADFFSYREAVRDPSWAQYQQAILDDAARYQESTARLERMEAKAALGMAALELKSYLDDMTSRYEYVMERLARR